jgi:gamma-glutamyltranspeptidase/glutathione hydrolase
LCEILNILENFDLRHLGWNSAASVHVMVEAMRRAYFDRNTTLGDPDFIHNPLENLLSKAIAAQIAASFTDRAMPSTGLGAPPEKPQTTHYSVMDGQGNAVSVTYTINGGFGSGVIASGTGFLLNNEMDDFTIKPGTANMFGLVQGASNAIAPGKRPLSSMAPTIVLLDGKVVLITGSPGGSRIISIVLQTILNMLDFGMPPQEAVDAPRIHHQWLPDIIYAEPRALSPDTSAILRKQGYTITEQSPWGAAELIAVGPEHSIPNHGLPVSDAARSGRMLPGWRYGANDSRRPAGAALGD